MKCLTLFFKILSFYNYLIVNEKVTDKIDLRKNFFCQQKKTWPNMFKTFFCVPYIKLIGCVNLHPSIISTG